MYLSRWLKHVLRLSGIDTKTFSAHSTRMASSSKAHKGGVGMDTILATAGWSSDSNFKKFYLRTTKPSSTGFASVILTCQE